MKPYYPQLDGLRALSVFAVILAHGLPFAFVHETLRPGVWGVTLFFVLSGFLITETLLHQIHAGQKPEGILTSFFVKRTLRIFPLYYLVLMFAFGFNLDGCRAYGGYMLTYALNLYNTQTGTEGRYLSHIWSLCVEEQFYLIWPFLLLAVRRSCHKYLFLSVIILAVVFRCAMVIFHQPHYAMFNYRLMPSSLDAFGIGALLAYLKRFHVAFLRRVLQQWGMPALLLTLFLVLTTFGFPFRELLSETLLRLCASACCFFLIGKAVFGFKGRGGRLLQTPMLRYLGRISYGIYLLHLLIQYFFDDYVDKFILHHYARYLPSAVQYNLHLLLLPAIAAMTALLASLSFYLVEKPFLRLKWLRTGDGKLALP